MDVIAVSVGPAVEGTLSDEVRILLVGLTFLYVIIADRFLRRFNIPVLSLILTLAIVAVPLSGIQPLRVPVEFIHIVHLVCLNLVLFVAGLSTDYSTIRGNYKYNLLLSLVSPFTFTFLFAAILYFIVSPQFLGITFGLISNIPFGVCLLVGSCLSALDAGAALRSICGLAESRKIPSKIVSTVKFESTISSAMSIVIYGTLAAFFFEDFHDAHFVIGHDVGQHMSAISKSLVALLTTGIFDGLVFGLLASWLFTSLQLSRARYLVFGLSIVCIVYAISNTMGGSGLISCFVAGFVLNNRMPEDHRLSSLKGSIEPFNEAAELFLCSAFAFRIEPSYLLQALPLGIISGLVMMFVARPLSILIFNSLSNLNFKEALFVGWCGLKSVVTLALSFELVELMSEFPGLNHAAAAVTAYKVQAIIFVAVYFNLILQGVTIPRLAKSIFLRSSSATPVS
jgi:cell volume regulation protein A